MMDIMSPGPNPQQNTNNFVKHDIIWKLQIILGNEDNYLNVNYLIEYFMKLT